MIAGSLFFYILYTKNSNISLNSKTLLGMSIRTRLHKLFDEKNFRLPLKWHVSHILYTSHFPQKCFFTEFLNQFKMHVKYDICLAERGKQDLIIIHYMRIG
jgi:hypothetical protein